MRTKFVIALLAASTLSACATPETRLRNGLQSAGLSRDTSACMADRMIDKLSLTQLKRLSDLSKISDKRLERGRLHFAFFLGLAFATAASGERKLYEDPLPKRSILLFGAEGAEVCFGPTAVLAIGFSSYAFAEMDTVRRFGLMIASCVVVSLLAELVLTPALLRAVYGRSGSSANA